MKKLLCCITFALAACATTGGTHKAPSSQPASQPASEPASQPSANQSTSVNCIESCKTESMARAVSADVIERDCQKQCASS